MRDLVEEICVYSQEKHINVWTVIVKFRDGGEALEIDPATKSY